MIGLTKTFAREFASRNITSNAIAPGFIASEMTAKIDKKYEEQILAQIPLGKPAQPSVVAMATWVQMWDIVQPSCLLSTAGCVPLTYDSVCLQHDMAGQRRSQAWLNFWRWTLQLHTLLVRCTMWMVAWSCEGVCRDTVTQARNYQYCSREG